jgi:hypothetical protein
MQSEAGSEAASTHPMPTVTHQAQEYGGFVDVRWPHSSSRRFRLPVHATMLIVNCESLNERHHVVGEP